MLWPAELVFFKHFSSHLTTGVRQPMQVWSFLLQTPDLPTCHYIKFKQMPSYYPMLAPQSCGNECFFNWLGGHVLEERLPSAPNVLPSENELSTAWAPICIILSGSPKHVTQLNGLVEAGRQRLLLTSSHLLSFCWPVLLFCASQIRTFL